MSRGPGFSLPLEEFTMDSRLDLQALLEIVTGSENVYFQPPESVKLKYPCIIYSRNAAVTNFANDMPYKYRTRYRVAVIDRNPDSTILAKVAELPLCAFERHFTADNLNHDIYNIYY
jgi:hypothetical protein